ncbi:DNA-binding transcriptional regulator, FrmR family [Carnobacterium iners]|uniref:DNA-binding transcriptional regulator, FrmR family n=1 Tax=Carnobacterium iners TaxID=1073423 RepID=A0A1X7NJY9_9LACT|nr:metal-sensitive transcriptional regulator [Carnobacterium iners]SEK66563.1 DNA-binding transcriptional regulator, FrmR family [Carnobacterium iners]SMH37751.1 DNA-binding transcriptional regulator, FrmR family [Carnobacterium iners]
MENKMNEYKPNTKVINRIKRSEGQMRGVIKMMEEGQGCKEVVTQLSAIRTSIDRAMGIIVAENLVGCVAESTSNGSSHEESIKEAIDLLVKSR